MSICVDSGRFDDFNNTRYFSLMDKSMWFDYICEKYEIKITDIEKALDKQVSKKVNFIDWSPHCPTCNNDRLYTEDDKNMKYCSECGQKLDWSGLS